MRISNQEPMLGTVGSISTQLNCTERD